jgi:anti-sigma regulatory factor (Ser/Thr protein kinase)
MNGRQIEASGDAGSNRFFRMKVEPHPRAGRAVRDGFLGFARAHAIPQPDVDEFIIALGEALANAFEHAAATRQVEASCWIVGRDKLVAAVVDGGHGLPPTAPLIGPAPMPQPLAERGRGFSIMQRCTDAVAVRTVPGKGTAIILVRHLRHADGGTRVQHAARG